MTRFSANLGFLFKELPLPDAIRAAKLAGFDAVECHWPYSYDPRDIAAALKATGMPMIGLNTRLGDLTKGENGLSALPGRETEARAAIDEAIDYAIALECPNIHVMAGRASGEVAQRTFQDSLSYACQRSSVFGINILIEPLNERDAPGYFLKTSSQALSIIQTLNHKNLKLMFDCYHIQIMEGDISKKIEALMPFIGHVQIAPVPERAEPDQGELNYQVILSKLKALDYSNPVGAEYRPSSDLENGFRWLKLFT